MKSKIILVFIGGLVTMIFTGCYKDVLSPGKDPNAPPQALVSVATLYQYSQLTVPPAAATMEFLHTNLR
jgi:hypothetical protein